jgi:hypothetical protein
MTNDCAMKNCTTLLNDLEYYYLQTESPGLVSNLVTEPEHVLYGGMDWIWYICIYFGISVFCSDMT